MDNNHTRWKQGYFVDSPRYRNWTTEQKAKADREEKLRVRPYPTANAICVCPTPEQAIWIAERLNLAAKLERRGLRTFENEYRMVPIPQRPGCPRCKYGILKETPRGVQCIGNLQHGYESCGYKTKGA